MKRDAFSSCHPAVNFIFFLGALGFGMVVQHPAYLVAGFLGSLSYYLLIKGRKALRTLLVMLPLGLLIASINPLFNHLGSHVLFTLFGIRYTLEALLYGFAVAGVFLVMLLWFGCYSHVMTGDKFTALFGSLIPSLSLLLVMIFRMVPELVRKAKQISAARQSIGKGTDTQDSYMAKAASGMTMLASLTTWALEGSIITADSMRSRGYGTAKRTSFTVYRMTRRDYVLLTIILLLASICLAFAIGGSMHASYTPRLDIAPLTGIHTLGYAAYLIYVLIPTILHLKEALLWHTSKLKI